jgi:hypothetical protein
MKFGDIVYVLRGSTGNPPNTPGCLRVVKCKLIGRYRGISYVLLMQSDPLAMCDLPEENTKGRKKSFDSSMVYSTRSEANKVKRAKLKEDQDFVKGFGY